MSTRTQQPTQDQIDLTAERLANAADAAGGPQFANDRQTAQAGQAKADGARDEQQRRVEAIRAAAKQQRARAQAERDNIKQGDHVVIDLGRVPQELHTVAMRDHLRRLDQAGAHLLTGRAARIDDTPTGRHVTVETSSANHVVPVGAAVRADVFMDENDNFERGQ